MTRIAARLLGLVFALAVVLPVAAAAATPATASSATASSATGVASTGVGPPAYVDDAAHVLPAAVAEQISGELASFQQRTAHQLAVVTVPTTGGQDVESFSRDLFDRWGIGRAGVDDGGLLLVAVSERKVRVQVGQGLRTLGLTDDAAVRIVDDITPALHRGDYAGGLVAGERELRRDVGDPAVDARTDGTTARFGGGRAIAADPHQSTNPVVVAAVLVGAGLGIVAVFFVVLRSMHRDRLLAGGAGGATGGTAVGYGGFSGGGGAGGGGGAVGGGGGATGGF